LPGATERPGAAPAAAEAGDPGDGKPPFLLSADELPMGRQAVGLTVDVVAPQTININQSAAFKIVVRNNGMTDAVRVTVRDVLPEGLTFLSGSPAPQRVDALLTWHLGTVPAGQERVIVLNVKPTRTGAFDHAATVTMLAGGKSRTIVREPKLKVEQVVPSNKVLRGQSVPFKITVWNTGDGPARNVVVQAQLSAGLRHELVGSAGNPPLELEPIEVINPGERVVVETLVADAVQGGDQSCVVVASSADVVPGAPEARSTQTVTVVEPKLKVTVAGPATRYTDTLATYQLTVGNPGTAPAKNLKIQATIPVSGRLFAMPSGAEFDRPTRRLIWTRPQLDPGEKFTLSFQVRMGGFGVCQVSAEAKGDGGLFEKDMVQTNVEALADVEFDVTERRRVVDVGDQTTFQIKIVNNGTKEATNLLVSAELSKNLDADQTSGTDVGADYSQTSHRLVFPVIKKLGPGKSIELGIRVNAVAEGIATCRVFLQHDDLKDQKLDDMAKLMITTTRR
jgi:uncharacterized repeat protein (TIGR01451 family)